MIINNNEIVIKPIQEEDIPLFDKWLDIVFMLIAFF